ncbi:uncharacterized protein LOC124613029 [Schistocerca americana]|uniref:uncharacterized protein LOC124613029 n=1 Tax=Schistocerca americana TaxID=7009 RepID=UPI001F502BDA|nr:uncharacterized protein LOC124613029 [Schistocerca americana]
MSAVSYLLLAVGAAVAVPAAAYVPSDHDVRGLESEMQPQPQPQLLIYFPKTTEIGCFEGEQPPSGSRGVFFQLDRLLGLDYTCKFITYNMRDYRGTTDAYRFRRLVSMYPEIVRPNRKLQCDASSGDLEEPQGAEFVILRDGVRRRCRMVAEADSRADAGKLQLLEGYKRLPGGALLLRAWYDLPPLSRSRGLGRSRSRYGRSPQLSRAQEAARRQDSAAAAVARIHAETQRRKLNGGRG